MESSVLQAPFSWWVDFDDEALPPQYVHNAKSTLNVNKIAKFLNHSFQYVAVSGYTNRWQVTQPTGSQSISDCIAKACISCGFDSNLEVIKPSARLYLNTNRSDYLSCFLWVNSGSNHLRTTTQNIGWQSVRSKENNLLIKICSGPWITLL